jgi:molecular chaperone DnaK
MRPVIGIDFGTTNSLCAWLDGDRPSIIPNARGARFTPSVVARSAKGDILVGESAKNQALVNPERTISGVKRMLGSGGLLALGDAKYRPEELAAFILGSLRRDAEAHLASEVGRAVISAPAHFSDKERKALAEAGRIAGLEVLRIVNEPTAAAVARAWDAGEKEPQGAPSGGAEGRRRVLLVYDFGGGTFDVTLLAQEGSECAVLASRGDGRLGGADLDRELRRMAAAHFAREGLDVDSDRFLSQQLAEAAERAKIELSERGEASVSLVFAASGGRVFHPSLELTRSRFEEIAEPYVLRSVDLAEKALADAGLEGSDVDALILSGGSSRMPLVRRMLWERLGLKPEGGINPEEIVALGAAAWASLVDSGKASGGKRLRVRDVVSRTYGVEADGGVFVPLIEKNCPVPASKSRVFTTVTDGQDSVEIHVLQGESPSASEDLSLGRFLLAGLRPAGAGEARVRVDFEIDESDMLRVSASDLETGAAQAISIPGLSREGDADSPEDLARKARMLAERLAELRRGLGVERGLDAELDEIAERVRDLPAVPDEARLRLLKAELEGLVGELLARRAEARRDAKPLGTRRG